MKLKVENGNWYEPCEQLYQKFIRFEVIVPKVEAALKGPKPN